MVVFEHDAAGGSLTNKANGPEWDLASYKLLFFFFFFYSKQITVMIDKIDVLDLYLFGGVSVSPNHFCTLACCLLTFVICLAWVNCSDWLIKGDLLCDVVCFFSDFFFEMLLHVEDLERYKRSMSAQTEAFCLSQKKTAPETPRHYSRL